MWHIDFVHNDSNKKLVKYLGINSTKETCKVYNETNKKL